MQVGMDRAGGVVFFQPIPWEEEGGGHANSQDHG